MTRWYVQFGQTCDRTVSLAKQRRLGKWLLASPDVSETAVIGGNTEVTLACVVEAMGPADAVHRAQGVYADALNDAGLAWTGSPGEEWRVVRLEEGS